MKLPSVGVRCVSYRPSRNAAPTVTERSGTCCLAVPCVLRVYYVDSMCGECDTCAVSAYSWYTSVVLTVAMSALVVFARVAGALNAADVACWNGEHALVAVLYDATSVHELADELGCPHPMSDVVLVIDMDTNVDEGVMLL